MKCVLGGSRPWFLVLPLLVLQSLVHAAPWLDPTDPMSRDYALFARWFQGVFDNDAQTWFQNKAEQRRSGRKQHPRVQVTHQRVNVPALGEVVYLVSERSGPNLRGSGSMHLAVIHRDSDRLQLRETQYPLSDPMTERLASDPALTSTLRSLTKESLSPPLACQWRWQRRGEQFEAARAGTDCKAGSASRLLSQRRYWRSENATVVPVKLRRADPYVCEVWFPLRSYGDPDEQDVHLQSLALHDQGGSVTVTNPHSDRQYTLQLRDKEYPYSAQQSDFFQFRIKEVGARRSAALVTTDPDPKVVSVNLGWMRAACEAEFPQKDE